ncbi:MAG: hypothetical protein HRU38_02785 [Saccharospirillaceae bacterium]|nr:hypothetical protein [Pseudomonadales bacterium]NRB77588.1 hypothetical protein [Saccharospirillaceae bacterium]
MNNNRIHTKCSVCGRDRFIHFKGEYAEVDTLQDWYKEYHPNLQFGDPVPNKCIDCFNELKIGDIVKKRFGAGSHCGFENKGAITKIYTSGSDTIYKVEYVQENKKQTTLLARVELLKI